MSPDGITWGEVTGHGFVEGAGLAMGFGAEPSDRVSYRPPAEKGPYTAMLLRYRTRADRPPKLVFQGLLEAEVELAPALDFSISLIHLSGGSARNELLHLSVVNGAELELDGIAWRTPDLGNDELPAFPLLQPVHVPETIQPGPHTLIVKYRHFPVDTPYRFSQERLVPTLLCNVVYPVRVQGQWIKHYTPSRWWDCLYTWDSGFIGLGLLELNEERAIENLNAYVTDPGNKDCAFIHHGGPVPVQFYLY